MANLYHSDLHLPRWKRVVLWLFEDPTGRAIFGVTSAAILIGPIFYFGWWWAITLVAWGAGFAMGHAVARSEWKERGQVDKL
jgi:hypothetical protein